MGGYARAVLVGVLIAAAMLLVSFAVTDDVPPELRADQDAVSEAVELLAPTLADGECPAVDRAAAVRRVRVARALVTRVQADPTVLVDDPSGTGTQIPMAEVPGLIADEIEGCLFVVDAPGPGWARIVTLLRSAEPPTP